MKELTVLSLFDGIACGRVALERAGIPVKRYIASEIEPNAIKVAMSNYPDIEQIGDVTKIDVNSLPEIDLLIGGSPCQGFSVMGKQQNFEDPRSRLFWEYVKILKATKPKYFLLENVKMKQEYSDIITEALGVEPRIINSRLVSGQNRVRAYWTNLDVGEIADKNISFQDILESGYTNRDKSLCLLESENRLCISSADLYRRNKTKFPNLDVALETIRRWGFQYKTAAFVWVKRNRKSPSWFWGLGNWTRANAEICLLATKGKPKRASASVHSIIDAPIGRHSEKPAETRDRIAQLAGGDQ